MVCERQTGLVDRALLEKGKGGRGEIKGAQSYMGREREKVCV